MMAEEIKKMSLKEILDAVSTCGKTFSFLEEKMDEAYQKMDEAYQKIIKMGPEDSQNENQLAVLADIHYHLFNRFKREKEHFDKLHAELKRRGAFDDLQD